MWFLGHFNPQTPENHPKYHPETIDFTAVFMVWRAGAPPGPLLAPKWGKYGFWGILTPKHLKTTLFTPLTPSGAEIPI